MLSAQLIDQAIGHLTETRLDLIATRALIKRSDPIQWHALAIVITRLYKQEQLLRLMK